MDNSQDPKLYRSLGIDALQDAVEAVEAAQQALDDARALRDEILIELALMEVPISKLARYSKLTRERVSKIASPRRRGV